MAFNAKTGFKRKYKRKRFGKRSRKYYAFKKRVKQIAKSAVKSYSAKKYYEYDISGSVTTTPGIVELTAVLVEGTGFNQREEKLCYMRKLLLKYRITPGDNYNYVRCMLVATREAYTSSSPPTLTNVLNASDNGGTLGNLASLVNTKTFTVLYDKTYFTNYQDGADDIYDRTALVQLDEVNIYKKLKYSGATGSAQNIRIFWIIFSDSAAPANPEVNGVMRIKFMDAI